MKLQNVRRGDIVERTFQAGTRWPRARVEQRNAYLYRDGGTYHFMDTETYDQFMIGTMLGDDASSCSRTPRSWSAATMGVLESGYQ